MKTIDKYKEAIEKEVEDLFEISKSECDSVYIDLDKYGAECFTFSINSDLNQKIIEIEKREFAIEMVSLILDNLYIHKDDYTRRRFLESLQTELTKLKSKI